MSTPTKRRVRRRMRRSGQRHDRNQKLQSNSAAKTSKKTSKDSVSKAKSSTKSSANSGILPPSFEPLEKNVFERVPIPEGYVFVPKGNVYITRHCRSSTKKLKKVVFVVYDKSAKRTLGLRVPKDIHEKVLELEASTAKKRSKIVDALDNKTTSRARGLLREAFPLMPPDALEVVLDHAFLKGSGRVGRASTMSDERKATFAVEAHIRHMHTPYESLLTSGVNRFDARKKVRRLVQAIKKTWEGSSEGNFVDLT